MLEEYYHYRGCSTDGLPTRKRLAEVGLSDVTEDLAKKVSLESASARQLQSCWGKTAEQLIDGNGE